MGILQVCLFGMGGMILAILVKQEKKEYGVFISMVICLVIMGIIISRFSQALAMLKKLQEQIEVSDTYIRLLLKMTGITYVAEFTADLCQEAGYQGIAKQVQIFAKVSILMLGMPVITAFAELMTKVLS